MKRVVVLTVKNSDIGSDYVSEGKSTVTESCKVHIEEVIEHLTNVLELKSVKIDVFPGSMDEHSSTYIVDLTGDEADKLSKALNESLRCKWHNLNESAHSAITYIKGKCYTIDTGLGGKVEGIYEGRTDMGHQFKITTKGWRGKYMYLNS